MVLEIFSHLRHWQRKSGLNILRLLIVVSAVYFPKYRLRTNNHLVLILNWAQVYTKPVVSFRLEHLTKRPCIYLRTLTWGSSKYIDRDSHQCRFSFVLNFAHIFTLIQKIVLLSSYSLMTEDLSICFWTKLLAPDSTSCLQTLFLTTLIGYCWSHPPLLKAENAKDSFSTFNLSLERM